MAQAKAIDREIHDRSVNRQGDCGVLNPKWDIRITLSPPEAQRSSRKIENKDYETEVMHDYRETAVMDTTRQTQELIAAVTTCTRLKQK